MKKETISVLAVSAYLLIILSIDFAAFHFLFIDLPESYNEYKLLLTSMMVSLMGGILYCLRAVYLNFCVRDTWDSKWLVWYFLRPITSLISGAVCYIFLKAGLMVLDAKVENSANNLGFYGLAFIAGLNVDKFLAKIEEIAETTWGIAKSRSSKSE